MARPTKLNEDVQANIVKALEAGNYFDASCEYAGIGESTGHSWMARGRAELARRDNSRVKSGTEQWDKEQIYVEFLEAISRASANVEVRTIGFIQKAGIGDKENPGDWRALTWFMEHRYPKKWGKKVQEHQGADGGAMQHEVTRKVSAEDLSDDELASILAGIKASSSE